MKYRLTLLLSIILSNIMLAQTTLSAGDIAIVQYNSDPDPEVIKFVAFTSMEIGTTINFTDNGWSGSSWRSTEGIHTWTATTNISCGEIVPVSIPNGGFDLAVQGDQVFAYQGDLTSSPTLIFGLNVSSGNWTDGSPASRRTALPSPLVDGTNAVTLTHIDNTKYTGSLSGTKAVILSNICNPANWTGSNTVTQDFTDTFTSEINWNTSWSGTGTPSDYFKAILHEDYITADDGDFSVCELQINTDKTLTVSSGGTVTIENNITNNGSILVQSGGSIVQNNKDATNTGSGYTVERTTTSQSSSHVFTYWSSPITSATFAAVALDASAYYSFNASTQSWSVGTSSTSMTPGVGYAMLGPDAGATYPGAQTASFTGSPFNNGDVDVTLSLSGDNNIFLGNPYPSAIDADAFLTANTVTNTFLGGTLYFWTHNTDASSDQSNSEDDYASYNAMGGTAATSGGAAPDGNIASGQGFFTTALVSGATTLFTNDMRISGSNTTFFRNFNVNNDNRDRIWLNLTNNNSFSQILIGFAEDAKDGVDNKYDGLRFQGNNSSTLYSLIDGKHYGIQGLPSLSKNETIPLGVSTSESNEFTITIDKREGRLEKSKIYLIDKLLSIKHRLDKSDYIFSTETGGTFNNRFELVLKTNIKKRKKDFYIYRDINSLFIKPIEGDVIKKIKLYNLFGNLLFQSSGRKEIYQVDSNKMTSGILIVKVELETGEVISKKIIN